jgi:RimJ/RimL family protein N-acetyltransferase
MLASATLRAVDAWWAGVFGCSETGLLPRRPSVLPRPPGDAFHGVVAMTFGEAAPVATLPPGLFDDFRDRVKQALARGLDDPALWAELFGGDVEAIVGPAAVRCADRETLRPLRSSADVRMLSEADLAAAGRLRAACTDAEWEHGGSDVRDHPSAGAFLAGELVALAGYERWGKSIAHISVVAHPGHRGRGLATAAVSRIAAEALDRRLIPQCRTLESNAPSVAIAERLGFVPYARSVAVRLRAGVPA